MRKNYTIKNTFHLLYFLKTGIMPGAAASPLGPKRPGTPPPKEAGPGNMSGAPAAAPKAAPAPAPPPPTAELAKLLEAEARSAAPLTAAAAAAPGPPTPPPPMPLNAELKPVIMGPRNW